MIWLVYLPLVLPVLLIPAARRAIAASRPEAAARVLTGAALLIAACSSVCLGLLGATLFDDLPVSERHEDHAAALGRVLPEPVPDWLALIAALLLVWCAVRLVREAWRRDQAASVLHGAGRPTAGLLVADWSAARAVAVPPRRGRKGHIMVTTGLLQLLDSRERAVVFAHEQAHLRRQHHRVAALASAAAAVNPLLRPIPAAVDVLIERSADEDAARDIGDRLLVARTIGKVALGDDAAGRDEGGLRFSGSSVIRRVTALLTPPSDRATPLLALAAAGLAVVATGAAIVEFIELARAWMPPH
ncbi:M56 family metallopeptidase [Dactylosporangium vinaceum]|uniref:M56 family metallopeptidase n=1 Tax=Dactylosporangium vinaceum TaxID=53362 RepID=A0ABV5M2A0_9ACTN|nr:M56 family metallopeptidase [Dactylosporangium vinaceum]UAB96221.1 M56 family metallopeptidase [Dactylosporangium vinaceum]